ncbi:unnamed protein product, partial [Ectocarpus sp. 12 AP-2014]
NRSFADAASADEPSHDQWVHDGAGLLRGAAAAAGNLLLAGPKHAGRGHGVHRSAAAPRPSPPPAGFRCSRTA